jgi:hypothetical protein
MDGNDGRPGLGALLCQHAPALAFGPASQRQGRNEHGSEDQPADHLRAASGIAVR